ncbi:uncharacterized protein [Diadema setosum]|uniref:uncharacterized protein n=1 Tax=Diadema setosum TaxID=31175 RepID=UPI003B3A680D
MAEPAAAAASSESSDEDGKLRRVFEHSDGAKRKMVRQPNRKQHEREIQMLTEQISSKEAELKSLVKSSQDVVSAEMEERDRLMRDQNIIREQKEQTIVKRKEYDDHIHKISEVITRNNDALSRIKANLHYKTEKAVDDAIRKLEYQLQNRSFTLREETRIVKEISNLKRSKKEVVVYQTKRVEIETDKRKREDMKKQRNIYFKKVTELKTKEDEIRKKLQSLHSREDEARARSRELVNEKKRLKKEIDNLYEMRRQMNAEFQAQSRDYKEFVELQREENERRKEEERRSQEANHRREWFEYEVTREPFSSERQQIECLIAYLSKLLPKGEGHGSSDGGSPQSGASPVPSLSSGSSLSRRASFRDEEGAFTILRKKSDDDDDVFQAATKKKKGKRKSWMSKPLKHSSTIFNQFASFNLSPPSTTLEVGEALRKLQAKLQDFEDAAASIKIAHSAIAPDASTTSSVSSGIVVTADVDDVSDRSETEMPDIDLRAESWRAAVAEGDETIDCEQSDASSIREPSVAGSVDSESLYSAHAAASSASDETDSVQQEGTVRSDSTTDECGSSSSEDGKGAGNVTDDSESTVVANEGESGHSSPREAGSLRKGLHEVSEQPKIDPVPRDQEEVDKDREDSGMSDPPETESRKGGIVDRKNENLRLIVKRREKDTEQSKAEHVPSPSECSSDYASNSTGSGVSTPTDNIPISRPGDTHPLAGKQPPAYDPDVVIGIGFGTHDLDE